ncbi:polyketide cyclase [Mycobacterium sp. B14F4]|uniref:polyketide cyclase n=1 Tax=Mycobacterium sp. B14F4 TaxID=3153565 RepID=UPI00325C4776
MTEERLRATANVNAPIETVFDVLADPSTHQAIDGTGWVRESLDGKPLTEQGQIFRMAMYHSNPNYPVKDYEMANRVEVLDRPHAIGWQPGQGPDDDHLEFGGWWWRYDLTSLGPNSTAVTLSYDWSAVPAQLREAIQFPPFDPSHLDNSLKNLAELAENR